MANRDLQSELVAITQTISLVQASAATDYIVYGTEFDTQGYDKVAVIVEPSRAITGTDDIRFAPRDTATSGSGQVALSTDKLLPTYRSATDFKVYEPTSPYSQSWGFAGNNRYVQIGFNGQVIDTSNVDLVCTILLRPNIRAAYTIDDPAAPDTPSTLP